VQTKLVGRQRTRQSARQGVAMRAHADTVPTAVDEKPAVTIRAYRADEKVAVIKPRAAHDK